MTRSPTFKGACMAALFTAAAIGLTACGGGGSAPTPTPAPAPAPAPAPTPAPPPPPPPPSSSNWTCGSAPAVSSVGNFKIYSGDCVLSYKLSADDYAGLQRADSNVINQVNQAVRNAFASSFKDEFDHLFLVWDFVDRPLLAPFGSYYPNTPQGEGLTPVGPCIQSYNPSCPKLMGSVNLTYLKDSGGGLDSLRGGPLLHEMAHHVANYVLPTVNLGHWGFSSVGGQLGGWFESSLQDLGNSRYQGNFGLAANGGNSVAFSPLELFLMGMIPASEVPAVRVAKDAQWVDVSKGIFSASGFDTYTAEQIASMAVNPPSTSKTRKALRAAVVVLTNKDSLAVADVSLLNQAVAQFTYKGPNGDVPAPTGVGVYRGIKNYWEATGGRATLTADNLSRSLR